MYYLGLRVLLFLNGMQSELILIDQREDYLPVYLTISNCDPNETRFCFNCKKKKHTQGILVHRCASKEEKKPKVTAAWAATANPPMGMADTSGRFNRFFNSSLSSATSIRFNAVMSLAILSIFGLVELTSVMDSGDGVDGAVCVAVAAALDSVR